MNFAQRFEELEIWQEARVLHRRVWLAVRDCPDFEFKHQIRSAALSVMNNIAEGFERRTAKDFARFLDQAKGSAGEVRSMAYAGEDVGLFTAEEAEALRDFCQSISRRIAAFTRSLRG